MAQGVAEGEIRPVGQRMVLGYHQYQRVIAKGAGLQVAGVDGIGDDANIGCVLAQCMGDAQVGKFCWSTLMVGCWRTKSASSSGRYSVRAGGVAQQAYPALEAQGVLSQVMVHALDVLQ